jgi:DNA primase/replicative DNA helicase
MGQNTQFFNIIKQKVDLEDYLTEHLNVDLVPAVGGRTTATCPFHEESTASFIVQESDSGWKTWHCFGACSRGGTVIDAVMEGENMDLAMEAAMYLNDIYDLQLNINDEKYKQYAQRMAKTEADIEKTQEAMASGSDLAKAAQKYLHNRGLNDETIEHFQLGVNIEDFKTGRIAIPIIDKARHPVSISNRALFDKFKCQSCGQEVLAKDIAKQFHNAKKDKKKGGEGKWKFCPHCQADDSQAKISWLLEQHPKYKNELNFDKSEILYNEYTARRFLQKNPDAIGLFITEGYGDVWAGYQAGHQAICSYNGAVLSDWQAAEAVELVTPPKTRQDIDNSGRPIILIPDFDSTGLKNIEKNITKLRQVSDEVEIQVVYGLDEITYTNEAGDEVPCKDLGDLLQHKSNEEVHQVLIDNRWSASEYLIRKIVEKKNQKTGQPFYSPQKQMQMVAQILSAERSKATLDGLVIYLAQAWESPIETIRGWFNTELNEDNATSYQHMFKTIRESWLEAQEFLRDSNVIPFGFKDIDNCLPGGGARPGQLVMIIGKSGTGKALSITSKVFTPEGYKMIADIKPGDQVIDPNGGQATVEGVYPQGHLQLYKVTFSDNSSVECCSDHLWKVINSDSRNNFFEEVLPLKEIINNINNGISYQIPLTAPVEFDYKKTTVEPYQYGYALSCSIRQNNKQLINQFKESRTASLDLNYSFSNPEPVDLFIPDNYKFNSISQRTALLQGILDSKAVIENSIIRYTTKSKQLMEDVVFLVESLGGTATQYLATKKELNKKADPEYSLKIKLPEQIIPFRSSRKLQNYSFKSPQREIISISPSKKQAAVCISVNSQENLYLTDHFVVTHNTMLGSQLLANMADNGGVNSIFFTLEQPPKSLFSRLVCQVLNISMEEADQLIISDDPEQQKRLEPLFELYQKTCFLDNVPEQNKQSITMTPSRVQAMIQEANLTYFEGQPANVVLVDHLAFLQPDDDAPSDVKQSDSMAPGYIMHRLFEVCKATNVLLIVLQQLPKEIKRGVPIAADSGRGGSRQTDSCDLIMTIWRPEQNEELDDAERQDVEGQYKLALAKNRHGREAVAHLMFDKTSLQILPAPKVAMPVNEEQEPVIDVSDSAHQIDDSEDGIPEELRIPSNPPLEKDRERVLDGEQLAALSKESDPIPEDNELLLNALGIDHVEEDDDFSPDPNIINIFES